jgi:hypothetical protein
VICAGAKTIWLQEEMIGEGAAQTGLMVVMGRRILKERKR